MKKRHDVDTWLGKYKYKCMMMSWQKVTCLIGSLFMSDHKWINEINAKIVATEKGEKMIGGIQ